MRLKHLRILMPKLAPIISTPPTNSFAMGEVLRTVKSKIQLKIICKISTGATLPAFSICKALVWKIYATNPNTVNVKIIKASYHPK
jgi:hypothetical protein